MCCFLPLRTRALRKTKIWFVLPGTKLSIHFVDSVHFFSYVFIVFSPSLLAVPRNWLLIKTQSKLGSFQFYFLFCCVMQMTQKNCQHCFFNHSGKVRRQTKIKFCDINFKFYDFYLHPHPAHTFVRFLTLHDWLKKNSRQISLNKSGAEQACPTFFPRLILSSGTGLEFIGFVVSLWFDKYFFKFASDHMVLS